MKGLQRMDNERMIDQFIQLWEMLQSVTLSTEPDSISRKMNKDGIYTAKSAYDCQFFGHIDAPSLHAVWKVKVEPKVRFYLWLLLQNRNWTSDRLMARGWPHSAQCVLCDQEPETAAHITLRCPFAREVWFSFHRSDGAAAEAGSTNITIKGWWRQVWALHKKSELAPQITTGVYIAWNLWKERNRRTFEGKRCSPESVAALARDELSLYKEAFR